MTVRICGWGGRGCKGNVQGDFTGIKDICLKIDLNKSLLVICC